MTTPPVAFKAVTPNLIVRDIERSRRFYCDVLGFSVKQTVPDAAPFVFVWLERGEVTVFLNDPGAVAKDVPSMAHAGVRRHRHALRHRRGRRRAARRRWRRRCRWR